MYAWIQTDPQWASVVLRLMLGLVILPHGLQKLFGWFGGHGFSGTLRSFTGMGIPSVLAVAVIVIEPLSAVLLLAGFMTRLAAAGVAIIMVGAIFTVHRKIGFFMNWYGKQEGEGYEYHLLALAICFALMILGGGMYSLDYCLLHKV